MSFNYSEMRGIGYGLAKHALAKAPAVFNTNDYLDAYLRDTKEVKEFTRLAMPGAMLGYKAGIREAIRAYWDKSYKTPIWSEIWRVLEMYEHPERHNISLDKNRLSKDSDAYRRVLLAWMKEKEQYGLSDYRDDL